MRRHPPHLSYALLASAILAAIVLCAPAGAEPSAEGQDSLDKHRVSVAVARERAKTLHDVYAATLETMHHHYFRGDRATVPAKAMEDVFGELRRQTKVEARWISVSLQPMSINHEPKSEFEKQAAKEIAAGKGEVDVVEGGYYRRAGAIPLAGGCVSCHGRLFKGAEDKQRFAGLVISIPVTGDAEAAK
jgi:hypothetical protein